VTKVFVGGDVKSFSHRQFLVHWSSAQCPAVEASGTHMAYLCVHGVAIDQVFAAHGHWRSFDQDHGRQGFRGVTLSRL